MKRKGEVARIRDQLSGRFEERLPDRGRYRARLGDGAGNVRVPGKRNRAYARIEGRSPIFEVINLKVPFRNNLHVIVAPTEESPRVWEVQGVDRYMLMVMGQNVYAAHHHEAHELHNPYGGDDVTWIQKSQFMPLVMTPTDPPSMRVIVHRDYYPWAGGVNLFPRTISDNLSVYLPGAGLFRYVLITIDGATNALQYTAGGTFPVWPPTPEETALPTFPTGAVIVGAVYLENGTTTVEWRDLYDLRIFNSTLGALGGSDVNLRFLPGSTYRTVQDWADTTQSSGIISGGAITDNGDGTVYVGSGTMFIRAIPGEIEDVYFGDFADDPALVLANNSLNYIYIAYNGGVPIPAATVTETDIDTFTEVRLGIAYRDGVTCHCLPDHNCAHDIANQLQHYLRMVHGLIRGYGLVTSVSGAQRTLLITAGGIHLALEMFPIAQVDTDPGGAADTFTYWYNDGAWQTVAAQSAIDNVQYNDYGVGLANVGLNNYGVHWVYMHADGDVHIVYGIGNYNKLTEAEDAGLPANLPPIVAPFSMLIAKIIIERNAAVWDSLELPWEVVFAGALTTDHNSLVNLQGGVADDEYYHLSSGSYAAVELMASAGITVVQWGYVSAMDQGVATTDSPTFAGLTMTGDIDLSGGATVDGLDLSELGTMLFNEADGLLLLGPDGEITPAQWWSLRKQEATLTGAFHQEAGRWQGTKALVIEEATTNMVVNPSIETNLNSWTLVDADASVTRTRSTEESRYGDYSIKMVNTDAGDNDYSTITFAIAGNTIYTITAWVRVTDFTAGAIANRGLMVGDGVAAGSVVQITAENNQWQRLEITYTTDALGVNLFIRLYSPQGTIYWDAVQCEQKAYATNYCDGSLGTGYAWTGVAHASTSTRTVTEVNLDAHAGLIASNNTLSFRVVFQVPYDADAAWSDANAKIWAATGLELRFQHATDKFWVYIEDGWHLEGTAQTFEAGDWLDVVVTYDFTADVYNLYINGELDATYTGAQVSGAVTDWNLGSSVVGTQQCGCNFAEYAAFDRGLTADEVANLHALQRPLVDAGALDSPSPMMDGLYGYEKFGGFLYWEGMVMAGGEVEVIPDGAGDVVYGTRAMGIATDRGANTVQSTYSLDTPGAASNTTGIYLDGVNSVDLRLYSTGRLTIDEVAGVAPIYVNLMLIWQ